MNSKIEKKKQPKAICNIISNAMVQHGFVMDIEIVRDWLWRFYGIRVQVASSGGNYPTYSGIVFVNPKLGLSNRVNGKEAEFDTKEEAMEDAVKLALTLIK